MATILVTGGAGFLGSHLCDRLIARGDEVICVDNFFTGRKENVAHLLSHPRFEVVRHDIVHPLHLEVDQIYNMACPASPEHYQFNAIKTIKTSTVGMVNMLGQTEDYWGHVNPIGLRSCYDEGKRVAETLCMEYHRAHKLDVRLIRIFNTYGPRMDPKDGRVVSNFITQALRGEPITVYGTGEQTRSFCYVDDLINGIMRMMDQNEQIGPVNLGNPGEFTMLELAQQVLELTGSKSELVFRPLPSDDPKQRCPDITRAKAWLGGWEPQVPLRAGLEKTIPYYRAQLGL